MWGPEIPSQCSIIQTSYWNLQESKKAVARSALKDAIKTSPKECLTQLMTTFSQTSPVPRLPPLVILMTHYSRHAKTTRYLRNQAVCVARELIASETNPASLSDAPRDSK